MNLSLNGADLDSRGTVSDVSANIEHTRDETMVAAVARLLDHPSYGTFFMTLQSDDKLE